MAPEKAPAFQFYPRDFLTDGNVAAMSLQDRGAYITLLCLCWTERSLPADNSKLARMLGVPLRMMQRLRPSVIDPCFVQEGDRLLHPRLEKERTKQDNYRRRQSDKGKASANRRATERQPDGNHGSTAVQPDTQPNGNSSVCYLQSAREHTRADDPNDENGHPVARFMRVIYPEIYAKVRHGATYRLNEARDFEPCVQLVETYGDRLPLILEYFLHLPPGKDVLNQPGTPRQLLHMAPMCDAELRQAGR